MTNNLEDIVKLALQSIDEVDAAVTNKFELSFRRKLMQQYCNNQPTTPPWNYTVVGGTNINTSTGTKELLRG